jgi:hypothetical protein
MAIISSNILYQPGNFADDIIEIICEVKFESDLIESPHSFIKDNLKLPETPQRTLYISVSVVL